MINAIFGVIVPIVLFVVGGYLVIVNRNENISKWVNIAVRAAEQLFEHGDNAAKFEYVASFIAEKFKISTEDLETLIESAVYEVNNIGKEK